MTENREQEQFQNRTIVYVAVLVKDNFPLMAYSSLSLKRAHEVTQVWGKDKGGTWYILETILSGPSSFLPSRANSESEPS